MATQKTVNYPSFLWEQSDTEIDGRWSDAMIATWAGAEILVNPFLRATQAEYVVTLNLLVAVAFKYCNAFVSSSDSASL